MIERIKRAVFFGAHTDDEMACAGTLHRLARAGCEVSLVSFGPAATQADRLGTSLSSAIVLPEWARACELIGVARKDFVGITPSAHLHTWGQRMAQLMYDRVEEIKPDLVITLSPEDENPAHAEVGRQAERVLRGRCPLVLRVQYPWNFCLGRANTFVVLSPEDVACKAKVCDAYQSQKFRYNYGSIFDAQARVDGLSVKASWAERFELVRAVL